MNHILKNEKETFCGNKGEQDYMCLTFAKVAVLKNQDDGVCQKCLVVGQVYEHEQEKTKS